MGIIRDKKFEVLHHIPSCVAFTDQGVLVGNGIVSSQLPYASWLSLTFRQKQNFKDLTTHLVPYATSECFLVKDGRIHISKRKSRVYTAEFREKMTDRLSQ